MVSAFSAAVSLGNIQEPRAREVLTQALNSGEVVLQQAAIAALGEIKAVESINDLLQFVQSEDWLIRQRLAETLGQLKSDKSISALKYLAKDSNPQVSTTASLSLQHLEESSN